MERGTTGWDRDTGRQMCNLAPLSFYLSTAATFNATFGEFREDEEVMAGIVEVKKLVREGKAKTAHS